MVYFKLILFAVFVLFTIQLGAQEMYKIELRDSTTSEPVSFATVKFEGTTQGLIADYNGQFRLPKKVTDTISGLIITSIGYTSLKVQLDSLSLMKLNVLKMKPQVEELEAVLLQTFRKNRSSKNRYDQSINLGALQIVKNAVNSIKHNLSAEPHSTIGYYRDYQILETGEYYNLNEGIIEEFDGGILTDKIYGDTNKFALYSFGTNGDFSIDSLLTTTYDKREKYIRGADLFAYGGNELMLLNTHNPIRIYDVKSFSFVYEMTKEFLKKHLFSKGDIDFINDEPVITIQFNDYESKIPQTHNVTGEIKISLLDFSIFGFEYIVHDSNKSDPAFTVIIEYQKINSLMYLNYASFNNRFVMRDKNVFKEKEIIYDLGDHSLNIKFNEDFDPKSIKTNRFKVWFDKKKLKITRIDLVDNRNIKLKIKNDELDRIKFEKKDIFKFEIDIKRIRDINNRKIYEEVNKIVYQFREYFVQEVFENKKPPLDLNYMRKSSPLSKSIINDIINIDGYIVNSPLMNRKM